MSGGDMLARLYQKGVTIDNGYDGFAPLSEFSSIVLGGRRDLSSDKSSHRELGVAWSLAPEPAREGLIAAFDKAVPFCESPIERQILPWLLFETASYSRWEPMVCLPGEPETLPPMRLAIIPQLPIGKYRADFAIVGRRKGDNLFYLVECDGAEYHGNGGDKDRDDALLKNKRIIGISRFPGSKIWPKARECASLAAFRALEAWKGRP